MKKLLVTILLLIPLNSFAASSLGVGLVGYWPMDSRDYIDSSHIFDRSGNMNVGTLNNSPTKVTGKLGQAISLDGSTQYISAGGAGNFTTSNFTVSFWVNPKTLNCTTGTTDRYTVFIYKGTFQTNGWYFQHCGDGLTQGSLWFETNQSGSTQNTQSGNNYLVTNKWQLVTAVRSGTTIHLYYNGTETTYIQQQSVTNPTSSSDNLQIGKYGTNISNFFLNGSIDDVRIYNRALSAAEVNELYREGLGNHSSSFLDTIMSTIGSIF